MKLSKNYEYLANIAGKSNKYYLYEIIQKLLDIRNKTNIKNTDFPNLDLYIKNPTFYTFASLCINREIANYLKRINNTKGKILNEAIAIDETMEKIIGDKTDIEMELLMKDDNKNKIEDFKKMLTHFNKTYANSKELQLLNLALAKTDLKDAAYNNKNIPL